MRAYRRLWGGYVPTPALATIVCPADTRWQLRELLFSNTDPATTPYGYMAVQNAAGAVIYALVYAQLGAGPDTQQLDLHLIVEAGEKVLIGASIANCVATLDAVVYDPA